MLPKGGRGGRLMPSTGIQGRDRSGRAINNFDLQAGRATALAYARGATMPARSAATRAATCDEEQRVFERPGGGCCFGREGIKSRLLAVFSRVV